MSERYDGGPAFPSGSVEIGSGHFEPALLGMTLRDYFAAKAMQGLLAFPTEDGDEIPEGIKSVEDWQTHYAKLSYGYADAMLAEREK